MNTLPKYLLALALISASALITAAQNDERYKVEFYGGYSWLHTDTGINEIDPALDGNFGSHGFNASGTGNVHRYFGLKGDFSYHSSSETFTDGTDILRVKVSTSQFLGGMQVKDNRVEGSRWRPFAHVLAGVAHQTISAVGTVGGGGGGGGGRVPRLFGTGGGSEPINESISEDSFAMAIGGGLDVNVSRHVSIRVIQVDYNPIFFGDQVIADETIRGRTQNNFRIGVGLVFH